ASAARSAASGCSSSKAEPDFGHVGRSAAGRLRYDYRRRDRVPLAHTSVEDHRMADDAGAKGPDLTAGVPVGSLADGDMLLGHVGDDQVVLARARDRFFAIVAHCTHYQGPLAEGLVVGDTVRCPLHHACFSLETGEAVRAPALDPIA